MMRHLSKLLFLTLLCLSLTSAVHAESPTFTNDYNVEYFLTENQSKVAAHVSFTITITNLRNDVFVDKMSLAFPKTFAISNLVATDEKGIVTPEMGGDELRTTMTLKFNDPKIGKDLSNTFHIAFDQDNLFKAHGNIWEVMLPTIEDKTRTSYKITVHLPKTTTKKIAIAKPRPDAVENGSIIWNNPTSRTIYAVFGDEQYYKLNLQYHLKNPKSSQGYTDIALPPDTMYQKIYINSLQPPPSKVYTDDDGNYLARYLIKGNEQVNVIFDGNISVFTRPRTEVQAYQRNQFEAQKRYLLTASKYWEVDNPEVIKATKNPEEVYRYVTSTLRYNYKRLTDLKNIQRMGARDALANPDQAVCIEFTDTFVGLAREKGIYAREIEGYGFSQDPQLRPLSFVADVLHSWPEYYDERTDIWIPTDPTWEDTSGIDYFGSFDLNHITFAIHGKEPDYPLPAGMYKTASSKDVFVTAVDSKPTENINISIEPFRLPAQLSDKSTFKHTLKIVNNSNIYLWNTPITFQTENVKSSISTMTIPVLAPYEMKEIPFELTPAKSNAKSNARLTVSIMGDEVYKGTMAVVPYYFQFGLKLAYGVLVGSLLFLLIKGFKKIKLK